MKTKILLADEQVMFRTGIMKLFKADPDVKVVFHTRDGAHLEEVVKEKSPDIIILDPTLSGLDGPKTIRNIIAQNHHTQVIVLTNQLERHNVIDLLSAGASAYLSKSCPFSELAEAVHKVVSGGTYLCPLVSNVVVRSFFHNRGTNANSPSEILSPREIQVLKLIAKGCSRKEIAEKCFISTKTVETHYLHAMRKLNLKSTADLVRYAILEGLVSPEK